VTLAVGVFAIVDDVLPVGVVVGEVLTIDVDTV
jgi:hypothetical protein